MGENVFANNCDECGKIIGIDSKDLSYKEKHWHEACFLCNKCRTSLVDKQFGSKADRIYCGPCYDAQFATRCDGCGDVFKAGMKKMEYKTRQWHEKCFVCCTCKNPIGTKSFIPKEHDILRQVLRGEVRNKMHQMQQGDHPGRSDVQERSLAQGMLHLHPLSEITSRPEIHLPR